MKQTIEELLLIVLFSTLVILLQKGLAWIGLYETWKDAALFFLIAAVIHLKIRQVR